MTGNPIQLDARTFHKRLRLFCAHLKKRFGITEGNITEVDTVLIKVGKPNDEAVYQKSTSLHFWFFGYEFPETLIAINATGMAILTSPKKAAILESLTTPSENQMDVLIIQRPKDPSDSESQTSLESFYNFIRSGSTASSSNPKVGILPKDKSEAPVIQDWEIFLSQNSKSLDFVDIGPGIATILVYKDEDEQSLMKIASKCSSIIMKDYVSDQILSIIDDEKKVSHEHLSTKIEATINAGEKKRLPVKFPSEINHDFLEMCYPPIIQSGGQYNLRPSAVSNQDALHFGTILCSLGVRYKSYCSNTGRTFLIEPNKQQEKDYKFLLEVQKMVLGLMKPRAILKNIYEETATFVRTHRSDLEPHFVNNLGFSIGLEFRESDYVINNKNVKELAPSMVYTLIIGFQDILNGDLDAVKKDPKTEKYSLVLTDTILITKNDPILLTDAPKRLDEICFYFKNEKELEEENSDEEAEFSKEVPKTRMKLRKETQQVIDEHASLKRDSHQRALLESLNSYGKSKYASFNSEADGKQEKVSFREYESYRKDVFLPKEIKDLKIFVDKRNDSVVIPMYGLAVPFHISTIKNVSKSDEGEYVYLRINFNSPGRTIGKKEAITASLPLDDPTAQFVRAITYRSADTFHMNSVYKEISELKKALTTKENERKEMEDLVVQDSLVEIKPSSGKRPARLGDVFMRPVLEGGKRLPGDLEIHSNGIRYRSMIKSDVKCDILFSNIKHLFFQPCDNELIVLVHVHLKNPILIGKKKTTDIQFFREALEAIVDETGSRRRKMNAYGDEDEILQEQEERKRRAALNHEFKVFCERLGQTAGDSVLIDIPIRALGFYGVPFRQNVLLQPTRDCLVHLSDPPYLVVTLADVEIASLERILFGLKNFDLIFIWKDHNRPPQHIDSIPMAYLEPVKDWLDSNDIYYIQSNINFNWTNVMKTINEDPLGFYELGGWNSIQANPDLPHSSSEEEEEESIYGEDDEEDSEYADSEDDDEDYDEDEDDEDEEEEEEDDDYSDSEEEEEGMDWDELEEKTKKEESQALRNKRVGGVSSAPTKRAKQPERSGARKR